MCQQLRFHFYDFPDAIKEDLEDLCNGDELIMHVNSKKALLLIEDEGLYKITLWGNRSHPRLPKTGFCKQESVKAGHWQWLKPRRVRIAACAGWTHGVWFQVKEGIHGLLVVDEYRREYTYVLTHPATHYFKTMTGADRMPALIGQIL